MPGGHLNGVGAGSKPTAERSRLDVALSLARAKIPIFPCGYDKRPLTPHGLKDATTDEAQIRAWWERWPDARVGVPTGPASGLFVLDADTDKKTCEPIGERNLLKLGFDVVAHPWKQRTQGGGWHVFFRWESGCRGNTVGKIADGVDTRSNGGYFIAYDLDAVLNLVEALHA
jgi:hypothetical protein